jgi:LuxR family maltose regulon positive regulatory protein
MSGNEAWRHLKVPIRWNLRSRARHQGALARLQRAFDAGPSAPRSGRDAVAVPGIVDPLTGRELEVLEMLAAARSNQAIAGELVVSLDTVKKHVGHVMGKLGAANRTEAVARARELSLIP